MKWTLKSIALVSLLAILPVLDAERVNQQITIVIGTPTRVTGSSYLVNRLFVQSRTTNTGLVYILMGVPASKACDISDSTQLTAELGPGSSTSPGQSFSDPQGANGDSPPDAEDLSKMCVAGTVNGDKVIVSYWHRN